MNTVKAKWIDENDIAYFCRKCNEDHTHHHFGDFTNRVEDRISHCPNGTGVEIIIDDSTLRNLNQRNMKKYIKYVETRKVRV